MAIEATNHIAANVALTATQAGANNKQQPKFENVQDYARYLGERYGVNRADKTIEGIPASIDVSPAFLQKALADPEKMQWLEENLEAMQSLNTSMFAGTLTYVGYSVDGDGNIVMMGSGSSDPDGKIAAANAKRKREEKKEQERLEQKRLEEKREEQKRLEEMRQRGEAGQEEATESVAKAVGGGFQFSLSGESAKAVQAGLASALQSGIAIDTKA
ncbi:MAG: hypothetical protein K2N70_01750 [Helicobacter sp.]|nr:hypothetical protein [Helicobacter sp.]